MHKPLFALIDCNNFFVSCERLFRPDLEGKPAVVLSSNDGCAVARSNEAKALGIPMGAPAFKYRQLFEQHNVVRFSANFELYGDISRRITELLSTITPRIEVYSVDESFLDLSQLHIQDYTAWGEAVRRRIQRWVGVPVSIGIAPSKTLAKLASDKAKKIPELNGVLSFIDHPAPRQYLEQTPVEDIWGIGWRLSPRLRSEGIGTAEQLRLLSPRRAQQMMGILGRQLVAELNGTCCHPLEREGKVHKSISRTRTFGEDTSDAHAIEAALSTFAAQAAYRLRESRQRTRRVSLFLTTNKHKPGYRRWTQEAVFTVPTADTGEIAGKVAAMFTTLYSSSVSYHRAGVLLYDFVPDDTLQTDLFGVVDVPTQTKASTRMQTIDAINDRYGKRTIRLAAEKLGDTWKPKYELRSPRYATRWSELPIVRAYT